MLPEILLEIKYRVTTHFIEFDQPIALFKVQELLPEYIEIDTALNYWDNYMDKNLIEVSSTLGNHETMFYEPHMKLLADNINKILNKLSFVV